jgi:hypothetical protein
MLVGNRNDTLQCDFSVTSSVAWLVVTEAARAPAAPAAAILDIIALLLIDVFISSNFSSFALWTG